MTRFRSAILILCFSASAALAQTGDRANAMAIPEGGNDGEPLALSLSQAVSTAAKQNLGVDIQELSFRATGHQARGTYGVFDPEGFADFLASSTEQPVTSFIASPQSERILANYGIVQTLPTGGQVEVGFDNSREENPFNTIDPSYGTGLSFEIRQPLLRNFGVDVTRRGINIARNTLGISREEFRNVLTQTTLNVEIAYLDLIFARRNLEVKQQSRDLAREQERITQIRIDVGASAPLDILQPRVAIATREEEVITAEAQIRNAEDRLRRLLNLPAEDWDRPIIPTDDTLTYDAVTYDMEASVAQALQRRPEIEQARLTIDTRDIERRYARNQMLPALNARANYGIGGVGGDEIGEDPVTGDPIVVRRGGYSDAFEQLYGFDFPSWTFGLNLGVPIRNIAARSEHRRAELELERTRTNEASLRQDIAVDVRQAIRDIETAAKQIGATRAAREAAEQNVAAERKRYENGMTTNFNVLLIQQELSDTRSREIAALVAYRQALADYHRAVGDLLEVHNISVDVPEEFDMPRSRYENVRWLNYGSWAGENDSK